MKILFLHGWQSANLRTSSSAANKTHHPPNPPNPKIVGPNYFKP